MIYIHKSQKIKLHQTALPIIKFQYLPPPKNISKVKKKVLKNYNQKKIHNYHNKGLEKTSKVQGEQKTGKNNNNHSSTSNSFIKPSFSLFQRQSEVSPKTFPLLK